MTAAEVRSTPTDDLLAGVKEGVEEIVRAALEAATNLHERADETLERYDEIVHEMTSLRSEIFGLRRDVEGIPDRLAKAKLDSLLYGVGEDPEDLQRRYIAARERLPVAEARIGKLQEVLASIVAGGSRPAKVSTEGGQRRIVKHNARDPILSTLNDVAEDLERLRIQLPDVVKEATADLLKQRDGLRDGQNQLGGLAKA
jgi:hypothetical protein